MSKQLLNISKKNFQKVKNSDFFTPNMVKMTLSEVSEGQILNQNLDFRGHIQTFWAKNTPKIVPFKAENNT